jgi:hypothetical protein
MRKPIGITVPYREVGFKTLEERIARLEKLYDEIRALQTKAESRKGGTADAKAPVQRSAKASDKNP